MYLIIAEFTCSLFMRPKVSTMSMSRYKARHHLKMMLQSIIIKNFKKY